MLGLLLFWFTVILPHYVFVCMSMCLNKIHNVTTMVNFIFDGWLFVAMLVVYGELLPQGLVCTNMLWRLPSGPGKMYKMTRF